MKGLGILFLAAALLGGCGGLSDSEKKGASQLDDSRTVLCSGRSQILVKNESTLLTYSMSAGTEEINASMDSGESLSYLNWGTLSKVDANNSTFAAPSFVPESRKLDFVLGVASSDSVAGHCYVHLLDDQSIAVADDGNTKGLVASIFQTNTLGNIASLTALTKSVVRNLGVANVSNISSLTSAPTPLAVRFNGTLTVPGGSYWFRLSSNNASDLYIDGTKVGSASNTTGTEIPGTATPAYNTGIGLTAGKHTIQVDYLHASGNATFKLEWLNTKPTGNPKPYTIIPPSAFDRD